jgi:hypothetical protein
LSFKSPAMGFLSLFCARLYTLTCPRSQSQ